MSFVAGCSPEQQPPAPSTTPPAADALVATFGHGTFLGAGGETLAPSLALFQRTQRAYLAALERQATPDTPVDATRALLAREVDDPFLANALLIDWLIEEVQPARRATMKTVNEAMRWHYLDQLEPTALDPSERQRTKGLGDALASKLAERGFEMNIATTAGGAKYIAECEAAGVPIPPPMFSDEWVNLGEFEKEFISESRQAELMYYESTEVPGACLALPRYVAGSDDIVLLGMICLGTLSNKACFWDNPRGTIWQRGEPIDISEFVGGYDLEANGQGVCSDCHSGENPFVVHPEKPAFSSISIFGSGWYEPIVHPDWPQNPGPSNLLSAVSSTARCDDCHGLGLSAGAFPAVSTALPGYCGVVLKTAAFDDTSKRTMPPYGFNRDNYLPHIEALRRACETAPVTGEVLPVDVPEDDPFVSPPAIIDPLYACAEKVAVRGAVLDAELKLYIDGSEVATKIARNPDQEVFSVPPLKAGQLVEATQTFDGFTSTSPPVKVRDHREDYPDGLPAPAIDPTLIHECAEIIAVRHVPGAKVTVWTNGSDPVTVSGSTGWTGVWPGKRPFDIGDEFTAQASLCDEDSEISDGERAVVAPAVMPAPTFDPPQTFEGQELIDFSSLVNGSRTEVEVSGTPAGSVTTPVSWAPNYDVASRLGRPLNAGEVVWAQQHLCSEGEPNETPPAYDCEKLPAPTIATPIAETDFVVVDDAVPGARIRVYDAGGVEIGDGSGDVINLRRPLVDGDVLTIVQQVGECTSQTGYQVRVGAKG